MKGLKIAAAECRRNIQIVEKHGHSDGELGAAYLDGVRAGSEQCETLIMNRLTETTDGK